MANKKIIHSVFEATALIYPNNIALHSNNSLMTYSELSRRSSQLAGLLLKLGVSKDVKVGVVIPHGFQLVVSLLSVFKSGGIYVPVDLSFSPTRLALVFEKYVDDIVITTAELVSDVQRALSDAGQEVKCLIVVNDKGSLTFIENGKACVVSDLREFSADEFETLTSPDDSNYIFFTSGSTGEPKAILGRHVSLSQFIHWEMKEFQAGPAMRVSQLIQFTFDASLRDIFLPLCSGGTLCMPPAEVKMNMTRLLQWLLDEQVTLVHTVPSLFRLMTKELALGNRHSNNVLPGLKYILLAGEPLYVKDVRRWMEVAGNRAQLVNLYGATETTLIRAFHRINEIGNDDAQLIPVGQPIDNTSIAIINDGRLCGIGEVGEVYIKSPFFTKGYLGNDELTAKVFVQNPLQKEGIDIVYKTGDLGRYTRGKLIEILGRQDRQVKVNGIRVELSEIEKAALSIENVEEVFVKVHQNAANQSTLVCYYVGHLSPEQLRHGFSANLNANMIPAQIFSLKEFPLNLNGKIDIRALPVPESLDGAADDYIQPEGVVEKQLEKLWTEVLGVKRVSRDTSFFHIGGHSLNAIQLISNIYRHFSVELKLAELFTHRTIRDLGKLLATTKVNLVMGIAPADDKPFYVLSHGQHRLWLLNQIEGTSSGYNIPLLYKFEGRFNADAMAKAFHHLIERHEILRTTLPVADGMPVQAIHDAAQSKFKLKVTDLRQNAVDSLQEIVRSETSRIFDLSDGPLLAGHIIQTGDESYVFVFNMHHIISDGWSMGVLVREMIESYNHYCDGEEPTFQKFVIQYKDYAEWQVKRLRDNVESRVYWHNQFRLPAPLLAIATDFARPTQKTYNGNNQQILLPRDHATRIYALGASTNASVFMILLAAVKALLFRYTGQQDIVVGVPVAGRDHPDLAAQIGFFVNTLPLRTQFDEEVTFAKLLDNVRRVALEGYANQDYPFDLLVSELGIERDQSRMPLFDIMVDMRNEDATSTLPEMKGLTVQPLGVGQTTAKFDLSFNFWEREGNIGLSLEYNTDLFGAQRARRITEHFAALLAHMIDDTQRAIREFSYLTADEKDITIAKVSAWDANAGEESLSDLFRRQAKLTPAAVAAVWNDNKTTYQELDDLSDRLAYALRQECSVSAGDMVALTAERSITMVIGMLGIMKAGAAYVPLAKELPGTRRSQIIQKVQPKAILTDSPTDVSAGCLLIDSLVAAKLETKSTCGEATSQDLAYVLFTSGSTGEPKGVMIEHRSIVSKLKTESSFYNLTSDLCTCMITNFMFDVSLLEIFLPLTNGGTLVIPESSSPEHLVSAVEDNKVNMLQATPSFVSLLLDCLSPSEWQKMNTLKWMCIGGESFSGDMLKRLKQLLPSTIISNHYGPTETTIDALVLPDVQSFDSNIIGRPLLDTGVFLLDTHLQPVPIGIPGEISIAGAGVARGYLNDDERTSLVFKTLPFAGNERIYCTGDIGRWREDGTIEFLGRRDDQVKLRGYRIELGDIENALRQYPTVKQAVVSMLKDREGIDQLAAYYCAEGTLDELALSVHLKNSLPAYMVPKYFVKLASFELNVNGKIDRNKLPAPDFKLSAIVEYDAPSSSVEEELAKIYAKILGRERVGMSENFYMLGGDSIKAVQIASRMNTLGYKIDVRDVLRYPMIKELSGFVKTRERMISQGTVSGNLPLTPIQREFFQASYRFPHHFNQSVMLYDAEGFNDAVLKETFSKLQSHHDMLRAVFTDSGVQTILPAGIPVSLQTCDLRLQEAPASTMQEIANDVQASIDLKHGPLMKLALFKLRDGDCLLITIHHLVVDGISWRILLEDISTLYRKLAAGEEAILPPKTDSFKDWSEKLFGFATGDFVFSEKKYWDELQKLQVPPLAVEYINEDNCYRTAKSVTVRLDHFDTELLMLRVNQRYNTQINDILLTAFIKAYAQVFANASVCIALEGHGRETLAGMDELDISRTVGWFTSVYPVVLSLPTANELGPQIIAVKESLRRIPNKGIGYGILKYLSGALENSSISPQISFNYLGEFSERQGEKQFTILAGPLGHRQNPSEKRDYLLEINGMITDGKLELTIAYGAHQFSVQRMQKLHAAYHHELREIIAHCSESQQTVLTPSDFEYTELSMDDLDRLLA